MTKEEISKVLKQYAEQNFHTQKEMAELIGISISQYWWLLNRSVGGKKVLKKCFQFINKIKEK